LIASVGLHGLHLEDKQHPSPPAHRYESEAESEEASLLVAEDDPTPGFECIDRAMLRVRRNVVLLSRRHRTVLCVGLTGGAWLLFSAPSYLFGQRPCTRSMPRIFSHRGFDASEALYEVTSQRSLRDLLDGGLRSFDLDLFWTDHDPEGTMFVGHPPSLRRLWNLPADLVRTPLDELRSRPEVKLLSLEELLRLLKRRTRALEQVSLELKNPEHPKWPLQLSRLYALLATTGIAHKFALVAEDSRQAREHLVAQRQHGVHVTLLQLHRDMNAPRDADGLPHFNRSAAAEARSLFGGWSVSVKLLEPSLMAAAAEAQQEVYVWVVDEEAALELAWKHSVHGLVTNRPKWAQSQVQSWYDEACAREGNRF